MSVNVCVCLKLHYTHTHRYNHERRNGVVSHTPKYPQTLPPDNLYVVFVGVQIPCTYDNVYTKLTICMCTYPGGFQWFAVLGWCTKCRAASQFTQSDLYATTTLLRDKWHRCDFHRVVTFDTQTHRHMQSKHKSLCTLCTHTLTFRPHVSQMCVCAVSVCVLLDMLCVRGPGLINMSKFTLAHVRVSHVTHVQYDDDNPIVAQSQVQWPFLLPGRFVARATIPRNWESKATPTITRARRAYIITVFYRGLMGK